MGTPKWVLLLIRPPRRTGHSSLDSQAMKARRGQHIVCQYGLKPKVDRLYEEALQEGRVNRGPAARGPYSGDAVAAPGWVRELAHRREERTQNGRFVFRIETRVPSLPLLRSGQAVSL
jgi:hypothetical protein